MLKYFKNNKYYDMIKIKDVSCKIMYDLAIGEKKLLAIMNATVSHEIRNPLNSIKS